MNAIQVYEGDGVPTEHVVIKLHSLNVNNVSMADGTMNFRWERGRHAKKYSYENAHDRIALKTKTSGLIAFKRMHDAARDGLPFDIEFTTRQTVLRGYSTSKREIVRPMRHMGMILYSTSDGGDMLWVHVAAFELCEDLHRIAGQQPLPTRGLSSWVWDKVR